MTLPPGSDDLIARALAEDLGAAGDITSAATIPPDALATASVVARAPGTISGLGAAARVFAMVDRSLTVDRSVADGDTVRAGSTLATVAGCTRSILSGERVALNLLGHLSGIATATRALVDTVAGTGVRITDTRKTAPGLRALEKAAVRHGGGSNHRFGLYDAVLIKDNHIAAVGSAAKAVQAARRAVGHMVTVEVEVETLEQLVDALEADPDVVLLDNMAPPILAEAVALVAGRCLTEASGGISLETIRDVADTGVDVISVGWITHSAPALDVALDLT